MKVLAAMSGGVDSRLPRHEQSRPGTMSPASIWRCPRTRRPTGQARVAAAPRRMHTMLGGPPTCSESRSTYGICRIASPRMW